MERKPVRNLQETEEEKMITKPLKCNTYYEIQMESTIVWAI